MLQTIRDRLTGWVAVIIIAGIGVALVLSFGKSRTDISLQNFAAHVNDEDISVADFRQVYQNELTRQQQSTREEMTPAAIQQLQRTVMDEMVRNRVVAQYVAKQGYRVDDKTLYEAITRIPAFQVGGQFSKAGYEAALAAQGITPSVFEKEQRTALEIGQLQNALLGSSFYTPAEFRRFVMLEGQRRVTSYVIVDPRKLAAGIAVTDADLKTYYDAHPDKFEAPESVALDYVEAKLADFGAAGGADDAQLRSVYDANPAKYRTAEQRRARHILIAPAKDRDAAGSERLALEVRKKLASGADFAALAKQYSNDPGSAASGGELGWAGHGTYVEPFEKALFALKTGETSDPVHTEFGYHIIQLEEVKGGTQRSFEDARAEIAKEAGSHDAQSRYAAMTEKMDDAALQNPNSLEPVAKATGLTVNHLDVFSRTGGGPFGANRPLINAVFSPAVLDEGENSPLIEVGEGHTVIARVAEHRRARLKPFAEVRAEAEAAFRADKAGDLAARRGQEILAQAKAGGDLAAVARKFELAATTAQPLNRVAPEVPAELLAAVYRAPRPAGAPVYGGTALPGGGYAVFRVDDVQAGRPEDLPREQRDARKNGLARQGGIAETNALANDLRQRASVLISPTLFEQSEQ